MVKNQEDLLKDVTSVLEREDIPYMVTGAYNVIFYGRPRASHDIDFVIDITPKDVNRVITALQKVTFDFIVDQDAINEAVKYQGQFNVLYPPAAIKLDFWLVKDDEFDRLRFHRRVKVKALGQKMLMATPEDTILQKLRWYDKSKIEKHLIDAAFVWQIQTGLDKKYMDKWARKLSVNKYLPQLGKIDMEEHY